MSLRKTDLFIGVYVLAAVIFMIVSIPNWLLDILVALNIAVAMIILFNALFDFCHIYLIDFIIKK